MESFGLVIFGITSNLAQIKLIPALYDMEARHDLPDDCIVVGLARKPLTVPQLHQFLDQALHAENRHHTHAIDDKVAQRLLQRFHYLQGDAADSATYPTLKQFLDRQCSLGKACHNRIYYLATYPDLYRTIFDHLKQSGLTHQNGGWVRLMIEKPIGTNLDSAKQLNRLLLHYFTEDQIYRLDHYLGKETLQNILTFRFGNGIFEPLMNHEQIDHIQVTAAEDFGIGARGSYYDAVGALKDVGQNHLLQMLSFATMDAPAAFTNKAVTSERVKILQHLQADPARLILGQYQGYPNEPRVNPHSKADTFFAFRTEIKNARFRGVPIYVRGGKKLAQTATEISVVFKNPVNRLFKHLECGEEPNVLIYRIQPNEAIVLKIVAKQPGQQNMLEPTYMQFCYRELAGELPDAYERLLLDAIRSDQMFFNDAAEVEAEWAFVDQLLTKSHSVIPYAPGSWGPNEAKTLLARDGRSWLEPSMAFCRV